MSDYIKIILTVICCCVLIGAVREVRKDYAVPMALFCAAAVILYAFRDVSIIVHRIGSYADDYGINNTSFKILFKAIGISMVSEFAAEVCADTGNRMLQFSVEIIGKCAVIITSLPLLNSVLKIVAEYINA